MANITLKGNSIHTLGELPAIGSKAPNFELTASDLSTKTLADYSGHKLVLNIFPSVDTGVCAQSVRTFNEQASGLDNTKVLCISRDLPFALNRFCAAEGLDNVVSLSEYKDDNFSKSYQVKITDGPLEGLMSRAVVVVNEEGNVVYTEQVPEIGQEPNYDAALAAIK